MPFGVGCEKRVSESMILAIPVITLRTSVGAALRLVQEHGLAALPVCEGDLPGL